LRRRLQGRRKGESGLFKREHSASKSSPDGNNHISAFSYDASGNATGDGTFTYAWNGESQLKSASGVNYTYDGDGRRVAKVGSKLYWYGSGDEILAETDASGNTLVITSRTKTSPLLELALAKMRMA
jgi:hypothetical protein